MRRRVITRRAPRRSVLKKCERESDPPVTSGHGQSRPPPVFTPKYGSDMIRPLYMSAAPLRTHSTVLPRIFCRHKSLTAAIERGRQDTGGRSRSRQDEVGRSRWNPRFAGRSEAAVPQRSHRSVNRGEFASKATSIESLPYTTAASEFLYGQSSVLAALKANRRKLYKLYVHDRGLGTPGGDAIVARAKVNKIPVQKVGDEYLRVMDRLSNGRPHNVRMHGTISNQY